MSLADTVYSWNFLGVFFVFRAALRSDLCTAGGCVAAAAETAFFQCLFFFFLVAKAEIINQNQLTMEKADHIFQVIDGVTSD